MIRLKRTVSILLLWAAAFAATPMLTASAAVSAVATPPARLAPRHEYSLTAKAIAELLSTYHYEHHPLDNKLSETVLHSYLTSLDPGHYYFLKSDVRAFGTYKDKLDNDLMTGDLKPAYRIFRLFQHRVDQRVKFALQVLNKGVNFDTDEEFHLKREDAQWPADEKAMDALWTKRVTYDALSLKLDGKSWPAIKKQLTARYERLARTTAQYKPEDVFQKYMEAWSQAFDPHTDYLSPEGSEDFDIHMRLSFQGIGAELKSENDYTEINSLIAGGPAAKSGQLHPGDRIIGVAQGDKGKMVDIVGWRLQDVVELIRGPKKSVVRLEILPAKTGSDTAPKVITLVRDDIKLEGKAAKSKIIDIKRKTNTYRIGVITVPAFYSDFQAAEQGKKNYRSLTRDVRRLLVKLKSKNIDGLVLDLRSDGGGALQEAVKMVGLFVPPGPVVQVRRSDGHVEVLRNKDTKVVYNGPLVVLTNRFSASASEIFAGAIQDYGRGVIVGSKTYGKGTVQTVIDLDQLSLGLKKAGRLKLTIAKFYRITGASTQLVGVTPDISLPSSIDDKSFGESTSPNPLPWDQIKPVKFHHEARLSGVIPLLRAREQSRAADSTAFQALTKEYTQLKALQNKTTVSLNEKARRRERDRVDRARLADINAQLVAYGKKPLKSLDDFKEDKMPDILLRAAAQVVADISEFDHDPAKLQQAERALKDRVGS